MFATRSFSVLSPGALPGMGGHIGKHVVSDCVGHAVHPEAGQIAIKAAYAAQAWMARGRPDKAYRVLRIARKECLRVYGGLPWLIDVDSRPSNWKRAKGGRVVGSIWQS